METVLSNIDILYQIFKYLSFDEQLELCKVCKQFSTVIVDFLWKNKFKELEITKTPEDLFVLSNRIDKSETYHDVMRALEDDRSLLNEEILKMDKYTLCDVKLKEFINLTINSIKTLSLQSYRHFLTHVISTRPADFGIKFDKIFKNLKSLTYKDLILNEDDIKVLNQHCPNLENLNLLHCLNTQNKVLVIGIDIQINTIQNLKMLNSFKIVHPHSPSLPCKIMPHSQELLTNLNIKELTIYYQFYESHTDSELLPNAFEKLVFGRFFDQLQFNEFNNSVLNNSPNLETLSLNCHEISINENFLKTCKNLTNLTLIGFNIKHFPPLSSIKELVLQSCNDLTWKDFKQILCDMKLQALTIYYTKFSGTFEYFNISTTLEHLIVEGLEDNEMNLFKMNVQNLANLLTLICDGEQLWSVAAKCPKLQTLEITSSLLLFEINSGTCYLLDFLKHPTLISLTIFYSRYSTFDRNDIFREFSLSDNIKSNLLYLNISGYFMYDENEISSIDNSLEFWLHLLNNNPKMNLMINNFGLYFEFLEDFVNSSKCPDNLKSININGFNIGKYIN